MLKATPIFQIEELKNYEPQLFGDEVWKPKNIRNKGVDPLYQVAELRFLAKLTFPGKSVN